MPSPFLAASPPVLPDLLRGPAERTTPVCDLGTRLGAAEPRQRQASAAGEAPPHPHTQEPLVPLRPVHSPPTCPIPMPCFPLWCFAPSPTSASIPPSVTAALSSGRTWSRDTQCSQHCAHLNHSHLFCGSPLSFAVGSAWHSSAPHPSPVAVALQHGGIPDPEAQPTERRGRAQGEPLQHVLLLPPAGAAPVRLGAAGAKGDAVMPPARPSARRRRPMVKNGAGARRSQSPELESIATRIASGTCSPAEPPREVTPFLCSRTTGGDAPAARVRAARAAPMGSSRPRAAARRALSPAPQVPADPQSRTPRTPQPRAGCAARPDPTPPRSAVPHRVLRPREERQQSPTAAAQDQPRGVRDLPGGERCCQRGKGTARPRCPRPRSRPSVTVRLSAGAAVARRWEQRAEVASASAPEV